jgi:hypothetical protein
VWRHRRTTKAYTALYCRPPLLGPQFSSVRAGHFLEIPFSLSIISIVSIAECLCILLCNKKGCRSVTS